jgi:hypothetical protein
MGCMECKEIAASAKYIGTLEMKGRLVKGAVVET